MISDVISEFLGDKAAGGVGVVLSLRSSRCGLTFVLPSASSSGSIRNVPTVEGSEAVEEAEEKRRLAEGTAVAAGASPPGKEMSALHFDGPQKTAYLEEVQGVQCFLHLVHLPRIDWLPRPASYDLRKQGQLGLPFCSRMN